MSIHSGKCTNPSNKCMYDEADACEVVPGIWLGNYDSSLDHNFLKKYKIRYILRLHQDLPKFTKMMQVDGGYIYYGSSDIIYYHIPIKDGDMCHLDVNKLFDNCGKFIHYAVNQHSNILIHCKRGHHRSATVVSAYLIKFLRMKYEPLIKYINSLRKCALRRNTCMTNGLFDYYLLHNHMKCKKRVCKNSQYYFCKCISS